MKIDYLGVIIKLEELGWESFERKLIVDIGIVYVFYCRTF